MHAIYRPETTDHENSHMFFAVGILIAPFRCALRRMSTWVFG
jgi:hypothetical protein